MALSHTLIGNVIAIKGSCVTIRLSNGSTVGVQVKSTHLKLGDYCNVAFSLITGKVVRIIENEHSPVDSDIIPSEKQLILTEDEVQCYDQP